MTAFHVPSRSCPPSIAALAERAPASIEMVSHRANAAAALRPLSTKRRPRSMTSATRFSASGRASPACWMRSEPNSRREEDHYPAPIRVPESSLPLPWRSHRRQLCGHPLHKQECRRLHRFRSAKLSPGDHRCGRRVVTLLELAVKNQTAAHAVCSA